MRIISIITFVLVVTFTHASFAEDDSNLVCVERVGWVGPCTKLLPKSHVDTTKCATELPLKEECYTYEEQMVCMLYKKENNECAKYITYEKYLMLPVSNPDEMKASEEEIEDKVEELEEKILKAEVRAEEATAENAVATCTPEIAVQLSNVSRTCNFLEESILNGGDASADTGIEAIGSLMLFNRPFNESNFSLATESKCEECHKKAFEVFAGDHNYQEVKSNLAAKLRETRLIGVADYYLSSSLNMRGMYNQHADFFEKVIKENTVLGDNESVASEFSSPGLNSGMPFGNLPGGLNASSAMSPSFSTSELPSLSNFRANLTCLNLKKIKEMAALAQNGCEEKVEKFVTSYSEKSKYLNDILGDSSANRDNFSIDDLDASLTISLQGISEKYSNIIKANFSDENIDSYYNSIKSAIVNNFEEISKDCSDFYEIRLTGSFLDTKVRTQSVSIVRKILEKRFTSSEENTEVKVSKKVIDAELNALLVVNPTFYYHVNNASNLCQTLNHFKDDPSKINDLDLKGIVNFDVDPFTNQQISEKEKLKRINQQALNMKDQICPASAETMVHEICSSDLENEANLQEQVAQLEEANLLSTAERLVANEAICKQKAMQANQPEEQSTLIFSDMVTGVESNNVSTGTTTAPVPLGMSAFVQASNKPEESAESNSPEEGLDNGRDPEILSQLSAAISKGTSSSSGGTTRGRPVSRPYKFSDESFQSVDDADSTTLSAVRDVMGQSSASTKPVEFAEQESIQFEDNTQLIDQMMNSSQDLLYTSQQIIAGNQATTGILNQPIEKPTQSELQEVLTTDENLEKQISSFANEKLEGENSEELLNRAILGDDKAKEELTEDLKDGATIAELEAEIEKLKKGAYASAAEKKALERAEAAEKRIADLEKKIEEMEFEKVEAARTSKNQLRSADGSFSNSIGVSNAPQSGGGVQRSIAGNRNNDTNTPRFSGESGASFGQNPVQESKRDLTVTTKRDPLSVIKNNDFKIVPHEGNFYLQIKKDGLIGGSELYLDPRDVRVDNPNNPKFVMIRDIRVPIALSTLDEETSSYLTTLVKNNPNPSFTPEDREKIQTVTQIQTNTIERDLAKAEAERYQKFRSCLNDPSQDICQ